MQIQSLYRDIREHRELFIRLPLRRAWAHREYRQGIFYMLALCGAVSVLLLGGMADVLYERRFVVLLASLPFLLMVIRCRSISDREQALLVEERLGALLDVKASDQVSLGVWEQHWFCRRYRCRADELGLLALEMEQDWSDWQRIRAKAGDFDEHELLGFFFGRVDSNRLIGLLAILLTILCTLVVAYGEGDQAYFELFMALQEGGWGLLLLIALLCMTFGLLWFMLRDMLRGLGGVLFERFDNHTISDRGVYRYLRQMVWVAGIEAGGPVRPGTSARCLQSILDVAYMPMGQMLGRLWRYVRATSPRLARRAGRS